MDSVEIHLPTFNLLLPNFLKWMDFDTLKTDLSYIYHHIAVEIGYTKPEFDF